MLSGIYQNAASMSGLESWNNAIAQNMAQASTPGYKKAILSFEGEKTGMVGYEGSFDKTLFRESITAAGKGGVDFSTGSIINTDIHTDFAIEGEGFFELRTPDGQLVLTRDGQFRINDQGELISKQGYHVMDDERNVIQLLPDGGKIKSDRHGSIDQNGQQIASLGVRNPADSSQLVRTHGGFLINPNSKLDAFHLEPDQIAIRHAALEQSNVSNTTEMVNLINVSRAFQINQQVIRGKDELLDRAIQTLGGRV